ncbi:MAG: hypothetical protein IJ560_01795 [Alphaproteobacteria bacterium]|nr:hypothetical protein [Alphaproteobacteria bacterium]
MDVIKKKKVDNSAKPKSEVMADLQKKYIDAKKRLDSAIESGDDARIAKIREIVQNLETTLNR